MSYSFIYAEPDDGTDGLCRCFLCCIVARYGGAGIDSASLDSRGVLRWKEMTEITRLENLQQTAW